MRRRGPNYDFWVRNDIYHDDIGEARDLLGGGRGGGLLLHTMCIEDGSIRRLRVDTMNKEQEGYQQRKGISMCLWVGWGQKARGDSIIKGDKLISLTLSTSMRHPQEAIKRDVDMQSQPLSSREVRS